MQTVRSEAREMADSIMIHLQTTIWILNVELFYHGKVVIWGGEMSYRSVLILDF